MLINNSTSTTKELTACLLNDFKMKLTIYSYIHYTVQFIAILQNEFIYSVYKSHTLWEMACIHHQSVHVCKLNVNAKKICRQ